MTRIDFVLNGECVGVAVEPSERLLDTLRNRLGLTGTKEGCGEGECGACTVHLDGVPVCSCLVPAYQARGSSISTVESIEPAQVSELHRSGASQCGACTPGVVMTAMWIAERASDLSDLCVRELMAGNLCRCTGYDGIIDGVRQILARTRRA